MAEVLNPLFFFLGQQNLSVYNIANLISKVVIIILILLFINVPSDSKWVNFIIGMVTTLCYGSLVLYAVIKSKLSFQVPQKTDLIRMGKENFYLTGNNISVHLQQSLMLFAIAKWGNASWLGAYSLCDKIIWSVRLMIMSVSNAIYPGATQVYTQGEKIWRTYITKMKTRVAMLFFASTILLFIFPELIVRIVAGHPNETAVIFLRIMAFLPTVAALNSLNVLELLIKNDNKAIFRIAMMLLLISIVTAVLLVWSSQAYLFGLYIVVIELCALLMFEYAIKKSIS
jgi:O-antigen/teichoic acid export membrane protein